MIRTQIRSLEARDAEHYHGLRLRALREEPEAFGSSYDEQAGLPLAWFVERIRETETRFTLGAFEGETLIGSAVFTRETGMKQRHRGVITGMYVAPEARGRGVGRALLLAAIERARAVPGVEQIHLAVVTRNAAAHALYAAAGFVVYGTEPHALKLGDAYLDEDLMVLWLQQP
ncbi:MAG: N-acetyltransferase family protein [Ktedonobacterales bacterium]